MGDGGSRRRRLFEWAFALASLAEIAPDRRIKDITIKDALAKLGAGGVEPG
jgi:hypothetical protein